MFLFVFIFYFGRLQTISRLLKRYNLDCYISFTADEHLNEYINDCDQVVKKITGFTGSNAIAITSSEPILITDIFFMEQVKRESTFYKFYNGKLIDYIFYKRYKRVGLDMRLISNEQYEQYLTELKNKSWKSSCEIAEFVNVDRLKVEDDKLMFISNEKYSKLFKREILKKHFKDISNVAFNEDNMLYIKEDEDEDENEYMNKTIYTSITKKMNAIFEIIKDKTLIITELDTIAWLFNIRGMDIKYNPVIFAYCIIRKKKVILFTDHEVSINNVILKEYNDFEDYLENIINDEIIISNDCNQYIYSKFKKIEKTKKIRELQTLKNENQIYAMVLAQVNDGICLCNLFGWIHEKIENDIILNENDIVKHLEKLKQTIPGYNGPSFKTISASGNNSISTKYNKCDKNCEVNNVYLINAGSHYDIGTTNITRTLFLDYKKKELNNNEFRNEVMKIYTLMIKSYFFLLTTKYKKIYSEIDKNLREYLRRYDLTYLHVMGYGVGQYLNSQEEPPIISMFLQNEIKTGQIITIESGYCINEYYKVHIKNMACVNSKMQNTFDLTSITYVPYQLNLIDKTLLNQQEKEILNLYNKICYKYLRKKVNPAGLKYLTENTKRIE